MYTESNTKKGSSYLNTYPFMLLLLCRFAAIDLYIYAKASEDIQNHNTHTWKIFLLQQR
jgi:hypothetical protein